MSFVRQLQDIGAIEPASLQAMALLAIAEQMRAANIIAMASVPQNAYETQSVERWNIVSDALK